MADLSQAQLRQWAVKGAEQRLLDITDEAAAIRRAFPELRGRMDRIPDGSGAQSTAISQATGRRGRRKTMSAEARRRISEAQKLRWAERRGETPSTAAKSPNQPVKATRRRVRKMSASARRRIAAAQRARWAEWRKKKGKAA